MTFALNAWMKLYFYLFTGSLRPLNADKKHKVLSAFFYVRIPKKKNQDKADRKKPLRNY